MPKNSPEETPTPRRDSKRQGDTTCIPRRGRLPPKQSKQTNQFTKRNFIIVNDTLSIQTIIILLVSINNNSNHYYCASKGGPQMAAAGCRRRRAEPVPLRRVPLQAAPLLELPVGSPAAPAAAAAARSPAPALMRQWPIPRPWRTVMSPQWADI